MKLVIVEDEKDILLGMKEALEHIHPLVEAIYTFEHAEQALSWIQEHKPEIVITDIVLQQMTGLDLIEKLNGPDYHPKNIIVSGYSNFEYAQRGIKLGVTEYILKPFDKHQFRDAVLGVIELIGEEEKGKQHTEPFAKLGTRTLRDKFVYGLCMKSTSLQEDFYHRLKFWDLDWLANSSYSVIVVDFVKAHQEVWTEKEMELRSFAIGNIVEEIILDYPYSVLFKNTMSQWALIAGSGDIERLTDDIGSKMQQFQKVQVRMGISESMSYFQHLPTAYEQATVALKVCMLSNHTIKQYYAALQRDKEAEENDIQLIVDCMCRLNLQELEPFVDSVLQGFVLTSDLKNIRDLTQKSLEWMMELHTVLSDQLKSSSMHHIPLELWEELEKCRSLDQIKECILQYLNQLAKNISMLHSNSIIEKMKRLISLHYAETITLQWIAEQLNIHPVSLSQLFKKECNQNFVDYLADIRVEEAKRLLRESTLKIYEIAGAVGYQDLQHFGQVFKKKCGQSPKEYRFGK